MDFEKSAMNIEEVLTFGKHQGKVLSEIEEDYLLWMFDNLKPSNPWRGRAIAELKKRGITNINGEDISGE